MRSLPRHTASSVLSLCSYAIGVILRYQFICVSNRPSDPNNILGDASWYVHEAVNGFRPEYVPTLYDTLFPPGAPMYFAALRWFDPSMVALDTVQWLLSCTLPLMLGYTALLLFGRTSALFVFNFTSLYFPLWEYYGYFISEGPFIFTMYAAFLLLIVSLQSQRATGAVLWGALAGVMLGASAACKSCALFTALLVFIGLVLLKHKTSFRLFPTLCAALVGVVVVLVPVSVRATRLNEGRFLLIANDAPRTFLLGHQGRAGLTWWIDAKRDFRMNFIYPAAAQRSYLTEKVYPFGPYETTPNYTAAWEWIRANPAEALLLSIEHVFDLFATALPWPGYFRPYVGWVIFFNNVFMALVLFPAMFHLVCAAPILLRADHRYAGDVIVMAAAVSIYILAFLFLGESRYRICYDGFMILLASRAVFPSSVSERTFVFDRRAEV